MIKNILTALFIAIVIVAVIFMVFNIYAKPFVVSRMENALGVKVGLEKISLNFPLSVELKGLTIGTTLSAQRITALVNPFGFIAGKILLDRIVITNPVIDLEQSSQGKLNLPKIKQENNGKLPQIFASRIIIRNGTVNFIDYKALPEGLKVSLNKINVDVAKVMLPPTSLKTKFNISAELAGAGARGLGGLTLSGWLDFRPKDMDAVFAIKDLDALYFTPYFGGDFLSHRKLVSATINLNSQLKAQDSDLVINNDLTLSNLKYAQQETPEEQGLPEFNITKNALDLFTDRDGNLKLSFELKTKLDHPDISQKELKKIILNAAMNNLASQNPADLIEKVSNIIEQASKYGKKMKDIFSGKAGSD